MRYPNILALILVILGVSVVLIAAIFFLRQPPPAPPPPEETTIVEETTMIVQPTTIAEETTTRVQTEPPSTPKETAQVGSSSCPYQAGNVFYEANWSSDMDRWHGSQDWKHTDSMLVSDGSPGYPTGQQGILAPCQPPTQDYAIEAQIQLIDPHCGATYKEFGLIARAEEQKGGIIGGLDCDQAKIASTEYGNSLIFDGDTIASEAFAPGGNWHTYRLAVAGNTIRLFVDDTPVLERTDNHHLNNGKVGMFSVGAQINVASFKILRL